MLNRSIFFTIIILILFLVFSNFLLIARVQQESMEPSLHAGQIILVKRGRGSIDKGDIVVFHHPEQRDLMVKRCMLSSGDIITIKNHQLSTHGGDYYLSYTQEQWLSSYDRVPMDHILVLGDNQFHSIDSRDFGFIKENLLIGRVITHNE